MIRKAEDVFMSAIKKIEADDEEANDEDDGGQDAPVENEGGEE